MYKKIIIPAIFIIALINPCKCFSQVVKIKNGITFSRMTGSSFDILNKNTTLYTGFIGLDYFEHDYFYLSSEIGYMKKGGKEYIPLSEPEIEHPIWNLANRDIKANLDYLQLNTTFRAKYPLGSIHVFAGIGPKIDILLHSKFNYENASLDELGTYNLNGNIKRISFALKPEIGFYYDISRFRIEGNLAYLINFGRLDDIEGNYNKIGNQSISVLLSFGYRLR
ncbi:MAG TPA: hypothetical protein DIT04_01385 [Dysgonomonas sp.]|nr:hypothetical protein [Dysgonomonas sp.]